MADFSFTSVLAPYISQLVEMKKAVGMNVTPINWILKGFDDYANSVELQTPHITEEFFHQWRQTRISDSGETLYLKYYTWRILTTLMCRRGCLCFIPPYPRTTKSTFTPYIFTEEQIATIFRITDNSRLYSVHMRSALMVFPTLFRLLYSTGLRISEALSIKNRDINLSQEYILIKKAKNGSERIVAISPTMKKALVTYMSYRNKMPLKDIDKPSALLFIKADGTPIAAQTVYINFRNIIEKCGIKHGGRAVGPCLHSLRHTAAVHAMAQMAKSGMDVYTALPILSSCLGHRSLAATEQYVRLTRAMYPHIESQLSAINDLIFPKYSIHYDNNN